MDPLLGCPDPALFGRAVALLGLPAALVASLTVAFRTTSRLVGWLSAILFMPLLLLSSLVVFFLISGGETVHLLRPDIDTVYAPGYSHEALSKIRPEDTKEQVLAALGPPLEKREAVWFYSGDGAWDTGDAAWRAVTIEFSGDRVAEASCRWHDD